MTELSKDRVWEQIETLRAQYALTIAKNQEIIVQARQEIATARELADQLPVAKTRKQKYAKIKRVVTAPVVLSLPMYEGRIYFGADPGVEDISSETITDEAGNVVAQARQTMPFRDDV